MYSDGVTEENYLRGVQEADDEGRLEFTTIFPATYSGRWPHMHFEVYESLDAATAASDEAPHLPARHPRGRRERGLRDRRRLRDQHRDLSQVSLDSDMVFSDGYSLQMAKVTGSVEEGYTVSLTVPV